MTTTAKPINMAQSKNQEIADIDNYNNIDHNEGNLKKEELTNIF